MRLHLFSASLLAIAISGSLHAADMNLADLRFGAGILSNNYTGSNTTTITNGSSTISTNSSTDDGRDADSNYRGQIQFVAGHLGEGGGFVWGFGAAVNHAKWDNGSQDATVTIPVVNVLLGYGYAFTESWHFEVTPFAGVGRAYYSVTDNGSTDTSKEWSKYIEFGAKIGTYFTLGKSIQLGVEVPYLLGSFEPDYKHHDASNNNDTTVTDKRENRGFGVLVTLGGRF